MHAKNKKIASIVEKYGLGFDEIYLDGYYDGYAEGSSKISEKVAKNLLADGFDEELISQCTSLPLERIRELKKDIYISRDISIFQKDIQK